MNINGVNLQVSFCLEERGQGGKGEILVFLPFEDENPVRSLPLGMLDFRPRISPAPLLPCLVFHG
jgi:hypothetical protein